MVFLPYIFLSRQARLEPLVYNLRHIVRGAELIGHSLMETNRAAYN